jgi:hypothetical protein
MKFHWTHWNQNDESASWYVQYRLTYINTIKELTGSESQQVPVKEMALYMFNFEFAIFELRSATVKFGLQLMQNPNSKFHSSLSVDFTLARRDVQVNSQ